MDNIFLGIALLAVIAGLVWYSQRKQTCAEWQRVYFFVIDNADKSDEYLRGTMARRYKITGYKSQFLIAAGRKHDQETFQSLYEMPNSNEPLN